jgi:hypothetical protein
MSMTAGRTLLPLRLTIELPPIGERNLRRLASHGRVPWVVHQVRSRPRVEQIAARDYFSIERCGFDLRDRAHLVLPPAIVARIVAATIIEEN